jgi:hypothetical protein
VEHRYLGEERFPETLSELEIEHFFTLDESELRQPLSGAEDRVSS